MKVIILTFVAILLLVSCSSTTQQESIKINSFGGFSEIKPEEKAKLTWDFSNADKVRIENIKRNFNSSDSIDYEVSNSLIVDFTVMNSIDTIRLKWRIVVKEQEETIKTGSEHSPIDFTKPSYIENEYLNGSIPQNLNPSISKLKISSYNYNRNNDSLTLDLIIMDDFGNLITDLSENSNLNKKATIEAFCKDGNTFKSNYTIEEKKFNPEKALDFAICLDNSAIAGDYYPIFDQIKSFIQNINSKDRFHIRSFNQSLQTNLSLQNSDSFIKLIKDLKIEKASGLSSIYKNVYSSINYINTLKAENEQIMVLIAYSSDNSSLVYDRNDLVELASNYNIPIYVIGVGSAVDSYSFKYISEMTGGKYYQIDDKDINSLYSILVEINLSKKANYHAKIAIPKEKYSECGLINTVVNLNINNTELTDSARIRTLKERHYFKYQSLASFDYKDTIVGEQHNETIKSLSLILKNNPDKVIELIGNASIEGTPDETFNIALRRAQNVRMKLIEDRVNPSQIRVRSEGANNPIYYFQESSWMQYYNRRVELRWLDPELMPYELIANSFDSETQALNDVQNWETKGHRVYYERYLQNNIPIYRVKIWGYRTIEEAERAKNSIERKYPVKLVLQ